VNAPSRDELVMLIKECRRAITLAKFMMWFTGSAMVPLAAFGITLAVGHARRWLAFAALLIILISMITLVFKERIARSWTWIPEAKIER